jgi:hypothetical protein
MTYNLVHVCVLKHATCTHLRHPHTPTHLHTHTHTRTHAHTHTPIPTLAHTWLNVVLQSLHTYTMHTQIQTSMPHLHTHLVEGGAAVTAQKQSGCTHTHTHKHTHKHTHTQTLILVCHTHTCTHTHTQIQIHTYTHTLTWSKVVLQSLHTKQSGCHS